MLRLWNLMKGSISRADAGLSYLAPCFLVSESRRRRTAKVREDQLQLTRSTTTR